MWAGKFVSCVEVPNQRGSDCTSCKSSGCTGIESRHEGPFSRQTSKLWNSYKYLWISPPINMWGWEICELCWSSQAVLWWLCTCCKSSCTSPEWRSETGYRVIEYENYPSRSCMRHDQNKFRSVPSKMLIWCPRYATNFYVVKVILLKHSLRRSRGKFFENIFSSPKKSENILAW